MGARLIDFLAALREACDDCEYDVELHEVVLELVEDTLEPEDLFNGGSLDYWAETHGYVKSEPSYRMDE